VKSNIEENISEKGASSAEKEVNCSSEKGDNSSFSERGVNSSRSEERAYADWTRVLDPDCTLDQISVAVFLTMVPPDRVTLESVLLIKSSSCCRENSEI
jgi:hypothetical protein